MRAIVLDRHGGPEVLRVGAVPDPLPGPGAVRVRVEAIGVNYAEILSRKGLYGWTPPLPYTLGMEATGTIDLLGAGVEQRAVGERVIVGAQHGAYAEQIVVPERQALPAIAGFSTEENAAIAVNYLTAWVALMEMARLRPTDRVLVTAAGGGVGTAALQIATRFGCTAVGLVGSDAKLATIRALGAEAAVNYRRVDFQARLREAAGPGRFDVVLEVVGGGVFRAVWPVLAPCGRVVVAGFASLALQRWNPLSWLRTWRDLPRADIRALAPASHGIMATHIGYLLADPPRLARVWDELMAFVAAHGIRPVVGATFALDDMAEAHRLMESRRSVGKIVVWV
ncbi:MAG: Quinone oxidoreductase [uncultured Chloroflexia bacterium]|uniref:Quinone oxidoreductase n=1 Tax=uncultured Chloroflexia bacterium TaxID=1672391 RepID=A0A6J4L3K5_9CHLR|nr:MAG: Quinone oxidoreductase [uncultured Chloroflexia bacterium]